MTLSYDMTLFALVRLCLTGNRPTIRRRRCIAHPARKRPMAEPCDELVYCAYASAILAHHKVRDDLRDERGLKRTAATAVSPFTSSMRRRAIRRGWGELDSRVYTAMKALSELEASRPPSADEPATLFGELMGSLLAYGLEGDPARLARVIGLHVGRWVYLMDAADDYAEDVKYHRYNPLACLYGDPAMTELSARKKQEIKTALLAELCELERAFDLLDASDTPNLGGVLSNILYEGMPREVERVLFGHDGCTCAHEEQSPKRHRFGGRGHRKGERS
jgi:hypothetical protein